MEQPVEPPMDIDHPTKTKLEEKKLKPGENDEQFDDSADVEEEPESASSNPSTPTRPLRDRKLLAQQKKAKMGRETSLWSLADRVKSTPKEEESESIETDDPAKEGEKAVKEVAKPKPPSYKIMVLAAINDCEDRTVKFKNLINYFSNGYKGVSYQSILDYVKANYPVSDSYTNYVKVAVAKLEHERLVSHVGKKYKLAPKKKKTSPRTSPRKAKKDADYSEDSDSGSEEVSMSDDEYREPKKKRKVAKPKEVKKPSKRSPKKESPTKGSPRKAKKETKPVSTKKKVVASPRKSTAKPASPTATKPVATTPTKKPTLSRIASTTFEKSTKPLEKSVIQTQLEIVFCFDTTGSMYEVLEKVQEKIGQIGTTLLEDIQGIRLGVIAVGDYEQEKPEPYVIKIKDFTVNIDEIVSFVFGVEKTYGGDWEEAYEYAFKKARTKLNWTAGYKRAMVFFGDAIPHRKDEYKKIDWSEQLDLLIKEDIKVYGVQCNSVNVEVTAFFKEISERSGGSHLNINDIDSLEELIKGLCYREAAEVQMEAHAAEIQERISRIGRQGSASLIMPEPPTETEDFGMSDDTVFAIHNAIHDPASSSVTVDGTVHNIAVEHAGCRFVAIGGLTFIQQNTEKNTKYAKMALEGHSITWIVRGGRWGLVVDKDIVRR